MLALYSAGQHRRADSDLAVGAAHPRVVSDSAHTDRLPPLHVATRPLHAVHQGHQVVKPR